MKVLVAGATGALGCRVVARLAGHGHDVVGTTRRRDRLPTVERHGGRGEVMDALDAERVEEVVAAHRPDVVVHALTAIPSRGPLFYRDMRATGQLRADGTRHLVQSALRGGVAGVVGESMVYGYGYGDLGDVPLAEDRLLADGAPRRQLLDIISPLKAMERELEKGADAGLRQVALRFGVFYGAGAGTEQMIKMLRRRLFLLPGGGTGVVPFVHVEDAAAAVVAAVESSVSGPVNVVDDQPVRVRTFLDELAAVAGTPPPLPVPAWVGRATVPYLTAFLQTQMRVSNALAKSDLRWTPQFPTYKEGLRQAVDELRRSKEAREQG